MSRLFRSLIVMLGIVCSMSLALAAPAAAQTPTVDVAEVTDIVADTDVDALLAALEVPMEDETLPEGFTDAIFVDPEEATPEAGLLTEDDLAGTIGAVAYTITGDPETFEAETILVGVQYVAFDEAELGDDPLGDFIEGAEGGLGDLPEGTEASVEEVEVGGTPAALLTLVQDGVVVQYFAVPVGNFFVFATVTVAGDAVDPELVMSSSEALAISAIGHLGTTAADS
ncbi:MAG: hypothetical protein WKF81_09255 [Thermomicrobiales bacterium]